MAYVRLRRVLSATVALVGLAASVATTPVTDQGVDGRTEAWPALASVAATQLPPVLPAQPVVLRVTVHRYWATDDPDLQVSLTVNVAVEGMVRTPSDPPGAGLYAIPEDDPTCEGVSDALPTVADEPPSGTDVPITLGEHVRVDPSSDIEQTVDFVLYAFTQEQVDATAAVTVDGEGWIADDATVTPEGRLTVELEVIPLDCRDVDTSAP